jgi:hypothetical protein
MVYFYRFVLLKINKMDKKNNNNYLKKRRAFKKLYPSQFKLSYIIQNHLFDVHDSMKQLT